MSESADPRSPYPLDASALPPAVIPMGYPPPRRPRPSGFGAVLKVLIVFVILGVVALSVVVIFAFLAGGDFSGGGPDGDGQIYERYHSGTSAAKDKIAIVRIDGILVEGLTGYALKQIKRAAGDPAVKAVILRVDSPGGSITASDDLYKRIVELRDGKGPNQKGAKKTVVVSMGGLAASGGYYISVPAEHIVAERSTMTGSIGVIASIPNIKELADKYGFHMNVIKSAEAKDSGSMFREMTAQDRQIWQDMIDHAFAQFIKVVEDGRPTKLAGKLREEIKDTKRKIPDRNPKGEIKTDDKGRPVLVDYVRRRADGGVFTADEALKFDLIDQIGYLEDAIKETHKRAGLGEEYKVIQYDPPRVGLLSLLVGSQSPPPVTQFDLKRLAEGVTPRVWYLSPHSELAGMLAAMGRE